MAFLDEDELEPVEGPGARRYGADRQRQILVRRLIALGVGVGIVILLLLGIRGCLDARKERGFENYVSDLSSIVQSSNQVSLEFFDRLQDPPRNLDETELQADINSDRGTASSLLERVDGLSTPDELSGAQSDLEQAFELRRDALTGIAEDIPIATAPRSNDRAGAADRIAAEMRALLASDVLYERARVEIGSVLDAEGIGDKVPASQFLAEPVELWIDDGELAATLSTFAAASGKVRGVHGLEAVSTTVDPGNIPLTAGAENTVTLQGDPEFQVEVQNGGESEERDVVVTFELSGAGTRIEGETTIASIDPQGLQTATLPLDEEPATGVPLALEVTAQFVPGETIFDNNTLTYTLTFEE